MKEEMSKARGDAEGEKERGRRKKIRFRCRQFIISKGGGRKSTKEFRVNHHDAHRVDDKLECCTTTRCTIYDDTTKKGMNDENELLPDSGF